MTRRDELIEQATAFAEDCDLYNDPIEAMADFSLKIEAEVRAGVAAMIREMPDDERGDEEGKYAQGCINTREAILEQLEATNAD